MGKLTQMTDICHHLLSQFLHDGTLAVDCTVGQGQDTIFLAKSVGPSGKVYGFDINPVAIDTVQKRLEALKNKSEVSKVTLLLKGHETLHEHIFSPVDVFVYNLGYLPGSDKKIRTGSKTTLESVKQAMGLVKKGGVISIASYPGHAEGKEEKDNLIEFIKTIDKKHFHCSQFSFLNQSLSAPVLFFIERKL